MRHVLMACLVAAALAAGCNATKPRDLGQLTPQEVTEVNQRLIDWFECEECRDGELERVRELGAYAVPALVATLERGPSPNKLETFRRGLAGSYAMLSAYAAEHAAVEPALTETEYVELYTGNYVARYQARAATALHAIGGEAAQAALAAAGRGGYRADVMDAIRSEAKRE